MIVSIDWTKAERLTRIYYEFFNTSAVVTNDDSGFVHNLTATNDFNAIKNLRGSTLSFLGTTSLSRTLEVPPSMRLLMKNFLASRVSVEVLLGNLNGIIPVRNISYSIVNEEKGKTYVMAC